MTVRSLSTSSICLALTDRALWFGFYIHRDTFNCMANRGFYLLWQSVGGLPEGTGRRFLNSFCKISSSYVSFLGLFNIFWLCFSAPSIPVTVCLDLLGIPPYKFPSWKLSHFDTSTSKFSLHLIEKNVRSLCRLNALDSTFNCFTYYSP